MQQNTTTVNSAPPIDEHKIRELVDKLPGDHGVYKGCRDTMRATNCWSVYTYVRDPDNMYICWLLWQDLTGWHLTYRCMYTPPSFKSNVEPLLYKAVTVVMADHVDKVVNTVGIAIGLRDLAQEKKEREYKEMINHARDYLAAQKNQRVCRERVEKHIEEYNKSYKDKEGQEYYLGTFADGFGELTVKYVARRVDGEKVNLNATSK